MTERAPLDPAPGRRDQARRWLQRLYDHLRGRIDAFRAQIDHTGLFPDLKGEAGVTLRKVVIEEGRIAKSYMLMCALSAGIATLGLLQSSTAVVIGAMLISPLMGPIASMGFGFASLDGHQVRDGVRVIAIGAVISIVTAVALTLISPIRNATPEIISRTEPTLLDLAVAILSGIAGAYATVQQKGATAIGVAIATALMPPLATIGYGIAVGSLAFAGGAFLLFLTNLAAIAFSFAVVARLSGAARPLSHVEITPRYVVAGLLAFAALATPLGFTLYRVTAEANARATVKQQLKRVLRDDSVTIAQLDVRWPLRGQPSVDLVAVAPNYTRGAEALLLQRLESEWQTRPVLNLQQVVAADFESEAAAIADAAVRRSAAGAARDVPPITAIRQAVGLPTQAVWVNRAARTVQVVPFAAEGWELGDYRAVERDAAEAAGNWQVRVVPPVWAELFVPLELPEDGKGTVVTPPLDTAIWAIERWGVQGVTVSGVSSRNRSREERAAALELAEMVRTELAKAGVRSIAEAMDENAANALPRSAAGVQLRIVRPPAPVPAPATPAPEPDVAA